MVEKRRESFLPVNGRQNKATCFFAKKRPKGPVIGVPHTPVLRVRVYSHLRGDQLSKRPDQLEHLLSLPTAWPAPVLLRVFPIVTFSPHLLANSPRLKDLRSRSNEYLTSNRFFLTTLPVPCYCSL